MSEDRFTFSETDIAAAIHGLREALGRSQEVMAEILGCTLPAYQKWEMGSIVPGGEWLIRLLRLCPDEETRNAFRIRAERRSGTREKPGLLKAAGPLTETDRRHFLQMARTAADDLYQCGEAGVQAADDRLMDFAQNLRSAADYFMARRKPS
ncbi:MAG TPA: helix-turn-helix domain-containing protein [Terriglobia bacterium]|nr:helix-turn-helix domain-containing protein [Terriglobia bacterium]